MRKIKNSRTYLIGFEDLLQGQIIVESQWLSCQSPVEVSKDIQLGHAVRELELMIFVDAVVLTYLWLWFYLKPWTTSVKIFCLCYFFLFFYEILRRNIKGLRIIHSFDFKLKFLIAQRLQKLNFDTFQMEWVSNRSGNAQIKRTQSLINLREHYFRYNKK